MNTKDKNYINVSLDSLKKRKECFLIYLLLIWPLHLTKAFDPQDSLIEFCKEAQKSSSGTPWYCQIESGPEEHPDKTRAPKLLKKKRTPLELTEETLGEVRESQFDNKSFGKTLDLTNREALNSKPTLQASRTDDSEKPSDEMDPQDNIDNSSQVQFQKAEEESQLADELFLKTSWQLQAGSLTASYEERGYGIKLQGIAYGFLYKKIYSSGWFYGLGHLPQQAKGEAKISDVEGRLRWESLAITAHVGKEFEILSAFGAHVGAQVGWREDRVSYRHQNEAGAVQFSETVRRGSPSWGYEAGSSYSVWDNWLLGITWQQMEAPVRISYGDGTKAALSRRPLWLFWIEYRYQEP